MSYRIAGIDVHKKMLAVVVSDVEIESEYQFERRMFGSNPEQLRSLAAWLLEQETEEVVMESTAQYWKPVWEALERYWKPICEKREGARRRSGTLHLAQALSNRGRRGRKRDFPDAERLVKRLVARELTLSFVPDAEQRLWRTVTRLDHLENRRTLRDMGSPIQKMYMTTPTIIHLKGKRTFGCGGEWQHNAIHKKIDRRAMRGRPPFAVRNLRS
jgi:Transposase